ncbi:MAG: hypothetical protein WBQ94_28130 [Terracidiphilus sp.]
MTPLTTQQQRDLDYARVSAVIDFVNEAEADSWRVHVIYAHSATWPWRKHKVDAQPS